ncbi:MAG TPA: barstar family protein [Pirellulales bacterium]|jgi:hypothetical protein
MAEVLLNASEIVDWDTFHTVCAREFGFPDFYGRNGNAWIDCLSYLGDDDGMCRFTLVPDEVLRITVADSDTLRQRQPEILQALVDWTAFVNYRNAESADPQPRLELVLL